MKIWEKLDNLGTKILHKTIDLQGKQIKMHQEQIKKHERLLKQLMQELGYPSWKIKAMILANYSKDNEDSSPKKK